MRQWNLRHGQGHSAVTRTITLIIPADLPIHAQEEEREGTWNTEGSQINRTVRDLHIRLNFLEAHPHY